MSRPGRLLAPAVVAALAGPLGAQEPSPPPQPPPEEGKYFAPPSEWQFKLGTDTAFTLSNLDTGSTNQTNDGSTNFDGLWLRLYARLTWQDKVELLVDVFSSEGRTPEIFGLYARVQPHRAFGVRVGLIPLVVGGWQERAYPHRQPLINQPLFSQYLLPIRNDSIPAGTDELLSQRGRGRNTTYSLGSPGVGTAATIYYEHCWDTGLEVFGQIGRLRYRLAAMEGTPGSAAARVRDQKNGVSLEGRLTYRLGESFRLGASFARGPYLAEPLRAFLPPGRGTRDYRQELLGADVRLQRAFLEVHAEWVHNRYESPYVPERLRTDGYYAEAAFELPRGVRLAARYSGLVQSTVRDSRGQALAWDADATRLEAGAAWRFFEDHVALKAEYQRTAVELVPHRREEVYALQLSVSY